MPKYLVEAHFTTEGAKGIAKEGGTARRKAIAKLMEGAGGKLEILLLRLRRSRCFRAR